MTPADAGVPRDRRYHPPRPPQAATNIPAWPTTPATRRSAGARRQPGAPSANRWLPPLDDRTTGAEHRVRHRRAGAGQAAGERVTVTRAAAQRSREMGSKMYGLFHRAATADGADKSGLTALT